MAVKYLRELLENLVSLRREEFRARVTRLQTGLDQTEGDTIKAGLQNALLIISREREVPSS